MTEPTVEVYHSFETILDLSLTILSCKGTLRRLLSSCRDSTIAAKRLAEVLFGRHIARYTAVKDIVVQQLAAAFRCQYSLLTLDGRTFKWEI